MVLYLTALNSKGEFRDFSCYFSKLEEALKLLQTITEIGDKLVSAYIIESNGQRVEIPLELFLDEESDGSPFQQLRRQWELALNLESLELVNKEPQLPRERWLQINRDRIDDIQNTVNRIEIQLEAAQSRLPNGVCKNSLIARYDRLLLYYNCQLTRLSAYF